MTKLWKIALVAVLLVAACNDKKRPPPFVPLPPPTVTGCGAGWTVNPLVNGVAYGPTACAPEGSFVFPECPMPPSRKDGVHTLVRPSGPLAPGTTVTVDFEIAGAGGFVGAQEQLGTPFISLFMQRPGDNYSGVGIYNEFRAYSTNVAAPNFAPLVNGRYQITQLLVRDQWKAVLTEGTTEGFVDLLRNVERIGVVFGTTESGAAHGICPINASTSFIMHSYTVQ